MGSILRRRLNIDRALPPGEEVLLALGIAAGDLGAHVARLLGERDLTPSRYNVLRILRGASPHGLSCAEIGQRLLVASPDVTRLVDPLVDREWVARDRSERDRRIVVQRLTEAGRALLRDLDAPLGRLYAAIADGLGPERAAALVDSCERVIDLAGGGELDARLDDARAERDLEP